jgi:hypothetical protein
MTRDDEVFGTLDRALRTARAERRRTSDECSAFRAFYDRVAELTTAPAAETVTTRQSVLAAGPTSGVAVDEVRTAYEETVMAVPHYDDEYGDGFAESFAAEFGDDVAAAFAGAQTVTGPLRAGVLAGTKEALVERETFLDLIDRETESLSELRDGTEEVVETIRSADARPLSDRAVGELWGLQSMLDRQRERVDALAADRQRAIADQRVELTRLDTDLQTYLYRDVPETYPGLAALASLGRVVEAADQRVERALVGV